MSTVSFVLYLELTVEFGELSLKGSCTWTKTLLVSINFVPQNEKKGLLIN